MPVKRDTFCPLLTVSTELSTVLSSFTHISAIWVVDSMLWNYANIQYCPLIRQRSMVSSMFSKRRLLTPFIWNVLLKTTYTKELPSLGSTLVLRIKLISIFAKYFVLYSLFCAGRETLAISSNEEHMNEYPYS